MGVIEDVRKSCSGYSCTGPESAGREVEKLEKRVEPRFRDRREVYGEAF
jgi:hypothetical protein